MKGATYITEHLLYSYIRIFPMTAHVRANPSYQLGAFKPISHNPIGKRPTDLPDRGFRRAWW